jgi:acetate kinase
MAYVLALNCGSSSIKYQVYDESSLKFIAGGYVQKIGLPDSFNDQKLVDGTQEHRDQKLDNHTEALNLTIEMMRAAGIDLSEVTAVGHRVVHGGDKFKSSVEITDEVIKEIESVSPLAPQHNPANLVGIKAAKELLPNARQVAVFDTAFHQTIPDFIHRYPLPNSWYRDIGVRKYGFHGTSHLYASKRAAAWLGKPASECNIIVLHIGSGASACAIKNGNSFDTSMGMTTLSGLMMGTRCGDVDVGVPFYVKEKLGLTDAQILSILNKESGYMGVTENLCDRRDVIGQKDADSNCDLALKMECHQVKKYIGQYMAALGRVDAVVFTAGVGENNPFLREMMAGGLEEFGLVLDPMRNESVRVFKGSGESEISANLSKIKVFVIPAGEEQVILEDTIAIVKDAYDHDHLKMKYTFLK